MSKNIDDVRTHLFAVLGGLADKDNPMELDRAKAICEAAQTIINSTKVEVDFLRVTGGQDSPFLGDKQRHIGPDEKLPPGVLGIKTHLMK